LDVLIPLWPTADFNKVSKIVLSKYVGKSSSFCLLNRGTRDLPSILTSLEGNSTISASVGNMSMLLTCCGIKPIDGIRTSKYKYFRKLDDPNQNVHLFDLENDPLEEQNIATTKPDVVEKMEKTMNQIIQKSTKIEPIEMSDDEAKEVEAELKKLGYI